MAYYDNVNEDLLAMIPPDATKVCEVGCGTGEMAKVYKRVNPECEYYGIEFDPRSHRDAESSGIFADVVHRDVEKLWAYTINQFYPDLDVLIYGDVLEHLRDPWKHLEHAVKEWVKPGGQVIACVPNVQNFGLAINLLAGSFEYQSEGLMDRTHLRFFTLSTLIDLFDKAGLSIVSVEPRNWEDRWDTDHKQFIKLMTPFVEHYGIDPKSFARETRAFQWLIKGVKAEAPARKILIRSFAANHCCARPRLAEPGRFLATIPGVRYSDSETEVRADETPVVIVQRDAYRPEQVRKMIHSGVLVIGEWDDMPKHFKANTDTDYLPIRGVHAVSTTTWRMADSLKIWNPNVGVFNNHLAALPPPVEPRTGDVKIFCGWQKRESGWREYIDAFNDILKDHPEVQVYVIWDREFFHAVETTNKKFWTFQVYEKYIELLRECDIAWLPLGDDELSCHKSDIKLIECAANNVFCLAPEESLYAVSLSQSKSGMSYRTIADFRYHLSFMINCIRQDGYKKLRTQGRDYVGKNRLLKDHYRSRLSWINALIDTREELTEQLFERCPELK